MKKPRVDQRNAIRAGVSHFAQHDRGRMTIACGGGKTLTSLWMAQRMGIENLLVALPSLQLQEQIVGAWLTDLKDFEKKILVVGSDKTIGSIHAVTVTTVADEIEDFLSQPGEKVVFTTYHSVGSLATACKNASFAFQFGIMDEADVTAGPLGKPFGALLTDDCGIAIQKRLFMTATPRFFEGENIVSMDDEALYGTEFFVLKTKEAIEKGILCDYKVLVLYINNSTGQELLSVLAQDGLRDAAKKYGIKKAISYHSSIKRAQDFMKVAEEQGYWNTAHVNHTQSAKKRLKVVQEVKLNTSPVLLTNSRALTFGFDMPECDCVGFIDPRNTVRDVVQSVGRILRKHPAKKMGYVFLPVLIGPNGWIDESQFLTVRRAISALASMDDRVADFFRKRSDDKRQYPEQRAVVIEEGIVPDNKWISDNLRVMLWNAIRQLYWLPYKEAKDWAAENLLPLGIDTSTKWREYVDGKIQNAPPIPLDIPKKPDHVYNRGKGWEGWGAFFGRPKNWLPYKEAKDWVRNKPELSTKDAWVKFTKNQDFPDFLPKYPNEAYENEWVSWPDFLTGKAEVKYWDYQTAHDWVVENLVPQGITTVTKFRKWAETEAKPLEMPTLPDKYYNRRGEWSGWKMFLGK